MGNTMTAEEVIKKINEWAGSTPEEVSKGDIPYCNYVLKEIYDLTSTYLKENNYGTNSKG